MSARAYDDDGTLRARVLNRIYWALLVLAASVTAAWLAWLALAQLNFLYPLWHDLTGIDRTIEVYAPQNRYRRGFEQTSAAERSRLFAAIVDAIHDRGRGLRGLVYHDPNGRPLGKLLHEAEVLHLQDVARLIDRLRPVVVSAAVLTVLILLALCGQRSSPPSAKSLVLGLFVPLLVLAGALLVMGPVKVFYWLHTLVFPPGHQWFFYYQDSLMSTMMQAPDLFGYIALVWGFLSLLLLAALIWIARRMGRNDPPMRPQMGTPGR